MPRGTTAATATDCLALLLQPPTSQHRALCPAQLGPVFHTRSKACQLLTARQLQAHGATFTQAVWAHQAPVCDGQGCVGGRRQVGAGQDASGGGEVGATCSRQAGSSRRVGERQAGSRYVGKMWMVGGGLRLNAMQNTMALGPLRRRNIY